MAVSPHTSRSPSVEVPFHQWLADLLIRDYPDSLQLLLDRTEQLSLMH